MAIYTATTTVSRAFHRKKWEEKKKIINLDHLFSEELKSASEIAPTPLVKLKALTNTIWEWREKANMLHRAREVK